MTVSLGNLKIKIDIILCIIILASFLNKEINLYFSNYITCLLFTVFHEFSHIFMASIFGKQITEINFTVCGLNAKIHEKNKIQKCWLFIYLAGPLSNLMLAILTRKIYLSFMLNMVLCVLNLLPIYPLDGFKILDLLLKWFVPNIVLIKITKIISLIVIGVITIIGVIIMLNTKNPSILLIVFYVINIHINY